MQLESLIREAIASYTAAIVDAIRSRAHEAIDAALNEALAESLTAAAPAPRRGRPSKAAGAPTKAAGTVRLPRRSREDITSAVQDVAALLQKHASGLRAEQIRAELGLGRKELPRILKQGVADGTLTILSGQRRSTTYGLGGRGRATKALPKAAKTAKRSTRRAAPKKAKAPKRTAKKTKRAEKAESSKAKSPKRASKRSMKKKAPKKVKAAAQGAKEQAPVLEVATAAAE